MNESTAELPAPAPSEPWAPQVLLRVEVGSTAHGTGLPGGEDYDELGIMAIPWEQSIGIPIWPERAETVVYRPGRGPGDRSAPGDYDLVLHSARKMARLCAAGNPSALMTLFGPVRFSHPNGLGDRFRGLYNAFWNVQAIDRFLGYSREQRERLLDVRGGKHTNRPELIEVHGYDTKYAMHMIRLGMQGLEYASTGRMTLPIPDEGPTSGTILRAIRRGEFTLEDVVAMADENEARLEQARTRLMIPAEPYWAAINGWLLDVFDWARSQESAWYLHREGIDDGLST